MAKKTYKLSEVARCYRVCFTDPETGKMTQEGKIVMKDLAALGLLQDDTFDENPYQMAKNSGAMMVANRVFRFVTTKESEFEEVDEVSIEENDDFINGNENLNEEIEL